MKYFMENNDQELEQSDSTGCVDFGEYKYKYITFKRCDKCIYEDVVDSKEFPKYIHILIPRTYRYIILYRKETL